jgi:hypothetical protein
MLVQSSAILFRHTIAVLDIQSDDPDFVWIPAEGYVRDGL